MGRIGQFISLAILNIASLIITIVVGFLVLFIGAMAVSGDGVNEVLIYMILIILTFLELYKWIVTVRVVIKDNQKALLYFVIYGLYILVIGIVMQWILIIFLGIAYMFVYLLYKQKGRKEIGATKKNKEVR